MAHFLIVDDDPEIRNIWAERLLNKQHTLEEAVNSREAIKLIRQSQEKEPYDLILLDHELEDKRKYGIDVLQKVDREYIEHRIVVITGHHDSAIAREYGKWGSIGHLIKPVAEPQFWSTIELALFRKAIYIDQKEDWESAYNLLNNLGILESIEKLQSDNQKIQEQYAVLEFTYQQLQEDLKLAGGKEAEIGKAYEKASEVLNNSHGQVEDIIPFLRKFKITKSFWGDVKTIFKESRLYYYALQSYLIKIAENPLAYRIKHLAGGADGHYEYRVGIKFRLYFRKESSDTILERFAHRSIQPEIIRFLNNNQENALNPQEFI